MGYEIIQQKDGAAANVYEKVFNGNEGDIPVILADGSKAWVSPSTLGLVMKTGDNMSGPLSFDDNTAGIVLKDANGESVGYVAGESNFGLFIAGTNDSSTANRPVTIAASTALIAAETMALKFNGAEEGNFLRILNKVDIGGNDVFPVGTVALDVTQYDEEFTSTSNFVLDENWTTIVQGVVSNTYFNGSSQANFSFLVENNGNPSAGDRTLEYSITKNNTVPIDIFELTVNDGVSQIVSSSDTVSEGSINIGDTVEIQCRVKSPDDDNLNILGATITTRLQMEQQASIQNATQGSSQQSTNTTLLSGVDHRITGGTSYTLQELSPIYDPNRVIQMGIINISGSDITVTAHAGETIYNTKSSAETSIIIADGESYQLEALGSTSWGVTLSNRVDDTGPFVVDTLNDLAQYLVGSVYKLPAKDYLFRQPINWGNASIELVDTNGVYTISGANFTQHTYTGTNPWITTLTTGVSLIISDIFVTTANATAISLSNGNSLILRICVFVGCEKCVTLTSMAFLTGMAIPMVGCENGLELIDVQSVNMTFPQWNDGQDLGGIGMDFSGASSERLIISTLIG